MALLDRRVTKSNELIEASYHLSLNESRLLLAAIASLDSRRAMPEDPIRIRAQDFGEIFGIETRHAYGVLKEAADALYDRDIRTTGGADIGTDGETTGGAKRTRWVQQIDYQKKEGYVTLSFTKYVTPYLCMLKSMFTSYEIRNISQFNSIYAIRLYELTKQYEGIGWRRIGIDVLRDRFELGDLYPRFSSLKSRVLDPAMKQINAYSDITLSYKAEREGKAAVAVYFRIASNRQELLALE